MDNLEGLKRFVIAVVGTLLIYAFISIRNSIRNKEINKLDKKISKINAKTHQLQQLKNDGILTQEEFDSKINVLKAEDFRLRVEYELRKEDQYKKIVGSYKKGLLNESERDEKISVLRNKIEITLKK